MGFRRVVQNPVGKLSREDSEQDLSDSWESPFEAHHIVIVSAAQVIWLKDRWFSGAFKRAFGQGEKDWSHLIGVEVIEAVSRGGSGARFGRQRSVRGSCPPP